MDSGTISQLVFFVFGAAVLLYGFVLYKKLAQLRDANDRARTRLNALVRELRDENAKLAVPGANSDESRRRLAELEERTSRDIASFDESARQYNSRIGQFPEAIVAATMGLHRRDLFLASAEARPARAETSGLD